MALPTKQILGILADNLRKRKSVIKISAKKATEWANGLEIPYGGETVLYTGHMYQLIPVMDAMATKMAGFEDSWIRSFMGIGRIMNKVINVSWFMSRVGRQEREHYGAFLRNIVKLLQSAGVEFGYLYGDEMYAGALVHDEGVDDAFAEHAKRVYAMLMEHGVRRVITVDPHTLNVMRSVYPDIIPDYDLEVVSYIEVLAEANPQVQNPINAPIAVHDSCVYARYENIVEQPRTLLSHAGAAIQEPKDHGRMTHCCGGPIESLFPSKARTIADKRMGQFREIGATDVAVMCPICLLNLQHAAGKDGPRVRDFSEILAEAYLGESGSGEAGEPSGVVAVEESSEPTAD